MLVVVAISARPLRGVVVFRKAAASGGSPVEKVCRPLVSRLMIVTMFALAGGVLVPQFA